MSSAAKENNAKQSLNDQLKAKYRLNSEPFGGASPFFYQGAQRQHNLETLRHLINFGDMVLVVTGESGSGKTLLVSELCKQNAEDVSVLSLKPSLISSPRKLVEELCKKLDVRLIDGEQPSRSMDRVIQHCSQAGQAKRFLVVVDDAQKLGKDTFRILVSAFKDLGGNASVSLLIVGRPDVMKYMTLDGVDPLHCGWMHQIQLKPFSQEEAVTYISLKLIRAGATSEPELTDSQIAALHELGKGCPGRINRIAPGVLLDTFVSPEIKRKPAKGGSWLLLGIAGALVISFLLIGYQYGLLGGGSGETVEPSFDESRSGVAKVSISAQEEESVTSDREQQMQDQSYASDLNNLLAEGGATSSWSGNGIARPDDKVIEGAVSGSPDVPVKGQFNGVAGDESALHEDHLQAEKEDEPSAVVVQALQQVNVSEEAVPPANASPISADSVEVDSVKVERHSQFKSALWLGRQDVSSFTIQVLGSRNEETAVKYVDQQKSVMHLWYVESEYKSKPWYVVITDVYPTKAAARSALEQLPKPIKKQKPWIRGIKGL